ncbi:MAG: hypothetical protein EP297_09185 [Gammaproteobacteria bacterium]|nr:MAG: hypothetical protein EP297_09185 [Gammaproteobacteria bacterium]
MSKILLLVISYVCLTSCGGDSSSGGSSTYTIGGLLSGLQAGKSVTMQNNGADDLILNTDGSFTLATAIANTASYNVQISSQPAGQTCTATSNTGVVAGANITNVAVNCVANASPTPSVAT